MCWGGGQIDGKFPGFYSSLLTHTRDSEKVLYSPLLVSGSDTNHALWGQNIIKTHVLFPNYLQPSPMAGDQWLQMMGA